MADKGRKRDAEQRAARRGWQAGQAKPPARRPAPQRAATDAAGPSPADPRKALAEKMVRRAQAQMQADEAPPPERRRRPTSGGPGLTFDVDRVVFVHVVLSAIALTVAALVLLFCYHMLYINVVLGRILGLPTGFVSAAAFSYLSVCYLGVIESTAAGRTSLDDHVTGEWREWFWTLPSSLGMLLWAGFVGYLVTMPMGEGRWQVVALVTWALYPLLQMSVLDSEFPLVPFSLPVLRTLVTRPLSWFAFYFCSIVPVAIPAAIGWASFVDPPYLTVLCTAPVAAVCILVYGWLFGQLTRGISKEFSGE